MGECLKFLFLCLFGRGRIVRFGIACDEGEGAQKSQCLSARPELLQFHVRQISRKEAWGKGAPWGRWGTSLRFSHL